MGLRFKKTVEILPGIKVNIGKSGIGVSAGVDGARVSKNSKGDKTTSFGIPGTGISFVNTKKKSK
jgi:hypothetical protein